MLVSIPISGLVAKRTRTIQRKVMAAKDERIKVGREGGKEGGREGWLFGVRSREGGVVVCSPISGFVAKRARTNQRKIMAGKDEGIKVGREGGRGGEKGEKSGK